MANDRGGAFDTVRAMIDTAKSWAPHWINELAVTAASVRLGKFSRLITNVLSRKDRVPKTQECNVKRRPSQQKRPVEMRSFGNRMVEKKIYPFAFEISCHIPGMKRFNRERVWKGNNSESLYRLREYV